MTDKVDIRERLTHWKVIDGSRVSVPSSRWTDRTLQLVSRHSVDDQCRLVLGEKCSDRVLAQRDYQNCVTHLSIQTQKFRIYARN